MNRDVLLKIYNAAVARALPAETLLPRLKNIRPAGRLLVFAAGKAAGSMAKAVENYYAAQNMLARIEGIAVARPGYTLPLARLEMVEAAHPVPDEKGIAATERTLALAATATKDDIALVLMSGGASANWIAPARGISLEDKRELTRALLKSGANIVEMNCVRKHLSRIKGGRLAAALAPARVITLAISDVPGDDPSVIGSGPTVPDATTLADARKILEKYKISPPASIAAALNDPANESPKPGDTIFANTSFEIVATPKASLEAAAEAAKTLGYEPVSLGPDVEGEAREVAKEHAAFAIRCKREGRKVAILSGGELTVTIRGKGRGGPNQEYAMALAMALNGEPGIIAAAGDTDGTDGGAGSADDPAGAFVDETTLSRAKKLGLDPAGILGENNSTHFFETLGDLLAPGPTFTNVNDLRAILVDT
ncbi:MAG: glycerate kinase [Xanthobacteraceae bacterium]|nr:glycerate kinase [Xanthobacteraceae bacterium]MCW5675059.1 glycerate kinase [Xanthobacteraceae bacterium]